MIGPIFIIILIIINTVTHTLLGIMDPGLKVHITNGSKLDTTLRLFASLSHETVWKLYQHYKIDFEMFEYDPRPYLLVAKTNKP